MIFPSDIDNESVLSEVRATFEDYESALAGNDLHKLDSHFWHSTMVVRYGISENLYGIEAIRKFRMARNATALQRTLQNTAIHTYGADFAITTTEFIRDNGVAGRQSQTWVRFPEGWRIVSAHVSFADSSG